MAQRTIDEILNDLTGGHTLSIAQEERERLALYVRDLEATVTRVWAYHAELDAEIPNADLPAGAVADDLWARLVPTAPGVPG